MLREVGEFINDAVEDRSKQNAVALAISLAFGGIDFVVGRAVTRGHLSPFAHGTINGLVLGTVAGGMTWFLLQAARERREYVRSQVQESARLNHEIRNALEVIAHAGYLLNDLTYGPAVAESVNRIKKSLGESKLWVTSTHSRNQSSPRPRPQSPRLTAPIDIFGHFTSARGIKPSASARLTNSLNSGLVSGSSDSKTFVGDTGVCQPGPIFCTGTA